MKCSFVCFCFFFCWLLLFLRCLCVPSKKKPQTQVPKILRDSLQIRAPWDTEGSHGSPELLGLFPVETGKNSGGDRWMQGDNIGMLVQNYKTKNCIQLLV